LDFCPFKKGMADPLRETFGPTKVKIPHIRCGRGWWVGRSRDLIRVELKPTLIYEYK